MGSFCLLALGLQVAPALCLGKVPSSRRGTRDETTWPKLGSLLQKPKCLKLLFFGLQLGVKLKHWPVMKPPIFSKVVGLSNEALHRIEGRFQKSGARIRPQNSCRPLTKRGLPNIFPHVWETAIGILQGQGKVLLGSGIGR